MTDQEVFTMLYAAMTDPDHFVQAVMADGTGHMYVLVESWFSGKSVKRGDYMTHWEFLLSPAPGFASAESTPSKPYHMRMT